MSSASVVTAHCSFEQLALLPLFSRIVHLMRSLMLLLPAAPSSPHAVDVLLRCARTVECCLLWHFNVDRDAALRYLSSASSETDTPTLSANLQPTVQWRPVLLEQDVLGVLVQCDRQLLSAHCVTVEVLSCLLPLTSLSGAVFQQPNERPLLIDSLIGHTCSLLDMHQQQQRQHRHHAQPLDGKLLSVVHSILSGAMSGVSLARLLARPSFPLWLSCLSHMTRCVLLDESFAQPSFTTGTDTTLAEALHAMLATWAELAMAVARREGETEAA